MAIRVAFIGTGGIAPKHSRYMKKCDDVEIVAGVDVDEEIVKGFWERTWGEETPPEIPAYTDLEKMYAEAKPDAVVICSPHTLHYEQAMQALSHGCHVLIEKPMVTSAEHAYALKAEVEKTGKILLVAFNTSCSAIFAYVRQVIRDGTLGKLEMVNGHLSQNWRRATAGSWRQDPGLSGGGQAYDSGAHILNSLCWSVESRPAQVFAFVDNMDTPVDINASISVKFENGVVATLAISGNCATNAADLHYIFQNGKIDVDGWGAGWIKVWEGREQLEEPPIDPAMDANPPAKNFVDSILGKDEPRTTAENGIVHSELMDAIYESARTGQVAVPKHG